MTECIYWNGPKNYDGYGLIKIKGKTMRAHRVAWVADRGPIPDGFFVLHACDEPSCVNIEHLWLGTRGDNNTDRKNKHRSAYGKKNGNAKLSAEQVTEIRKDTRSAYAIAPLFGVTAVHIRRIRRREQRQFT